MNVSRVPTEAREPRMEPLARLPIFLALEGKRAIVAGNGASAAWKVELLSAAGAEVDIFAETPCKELLEVAAQSPRGPITLHDRGWTTADFAEATIAVGGFDDEREAGRFVVAARVAGVPVNIIDNPAFCDFAFGSIVNRSPLVIGISTDGAAPVFAQAIRARLEAMIPRGFAHWVAAAQRWRAAVKASGLRFSARRKFWQSLSAFALTHPNQEPAQADFDRFMADSRNDASSTESGSVTLVGAGPGHPELLTLRAVRALQSADIILIDDLVAPEVLDFARREAKKMMVGKTGAGPSCKQNEINTLMIMLAKAGKRVVRLKGGDPMIFGRAGEEIAACRAAGIPVEVVPGITAAQGAASRLAVSLTQRRIARRLQYVTGHGENGRLPDDIDWRSIADPVASTAVYMPKKTMAELAERAIANGLPADTPAVAVAAATRANETVIVATLADIGVKLAELPDPGPVLVFVGRAFSGIGGKGQTIESSSRHGQTVTN
jgi:uroporphyrin-III C-methyltransferase/precorrin-2 dehydrogenase/sirohydrochlorin ferrochelatase